MAETTSKQFSNPVLGLGDNSRVAGPIRIGVGRSHIRATASGSAAVLGRQLTTAFRELTDDLDWFFRKVEDGTPQDMAVAMEPTFEKSKVYCPKDTMDLVKSGYMAVEKFRNGSRLEIGYGKDGTPDYAIFVHEMTYYTHEAPTQAKFLEQAINEDYHLILQRVTDAVAERTGL